MSAVAEEKQPEAALSPKEWKSFKLAKKVTVAENDKTGISTVWLRFSLDSPDQPLGLPVAACFVTRCSRSACADRFCALCNLQIARNGDEQMLHRFHHRFLIDLEMDDT